MAHLHQTITIVTAYLSRNPIGPEHLSGLITMVHKALDQVGVPTMAPETPADPAADKLVCLHCGKQFLALRNHLRACHDTTPEAYRRQWNLPETTRMVATPPLIANRIPPVHAKAA